MGFSEDEVRDISPLETLMSKRDLDMIELQSIEIAPFLPFLLDSL